MKANLLGKIVEKILGKTKTIVVPRANETISESEFGRRDEMLDLQLNAIFFPSHRRKHKQGNN